MRFNFNFVPLADAVRGNLLGVCAVKLPLDASRWLLNI